MDVLSRRFFSYAFACLALIITATVGNNLSAKEGDPQDAAPVKIEPVKIASVTHISESVTLAELSNGLTIIVQENHVAPVATVRCFVKNTGSVYEGKNLGAGISHVLEHVVAGGTTTKRPEKEISKIIDSFGGASNAFTSNEMTVFYIDCPKKNAPSAIELVADMMQHVAFEPKEFERELKVVRRELADDEIDRSHAIWDLSAQTIYQEHPVRHPVIGYLDVLNKTTNQTIIDFYHSRYVPNNQLFVVVGDVKTNDVLDLVLKNFAGTRRADETYVPLAEEPEQVSPREAYREMDGATCDFVFAWPTVKLSQKDMYALDVAAYILGEGESSRLVRNLRYDKQLALAISTTSETPSYVRGFFAVTGVCHPEKYQDVVAEIQSEIKRLQTELVAPTELAKAKTQKASELIFGRQTVEQAALSLGRNFLTTGDPLFDEKYAENVQKVTAEEVRDVALRYLAPSKQNRIAIFPPGKSPKLASQSSQSGESDIKFVTLPNKVRVLVKRQSNLPLVNIQIATLGGATADTEATAGRASLFASMLDQGTPDRGARQIAEYFDSIGGQFSTTGGRFSVLASATVLKKDFDEASKLFADCVLHPTFPQAEFDKMRDLALGAVARRADEPMEEASEFFYTHLPAGSPYRVLQGGTEKSLKSLTVKDLQDYHRRFFVPQNMIVTIFGDIDPDAAIKQATALFGGMHADPQFTPPQLPKTNPIPQDIIERKEIGKATGLVMLGYSTPSIYEAKDYAAMTLLDTITSGYSYPSGWLHNELRGEGLVYFVHALQVTGPTPGYFAVISQTQPEKVDEVVSRIRKNIEKAKRGDISEEEFRLAVQTVTALHAQENVTIESQARQAALDELYGLGYEYDRSFDKRIESIKREDVAAAAKKYLTRSVLTTLAPKVEK